MLTQTPQSVPLADKSMAPLRGVRAEPTSAQRSWMDLGFGLFVHFGVNTFAGVGWGDGLFPARDFAPSDLNCRQWAEMAAAAGMKYAVLTTKHHDGFCLWPTRHTEYCVRNSPGQPDVVRQFVDAFTSVGIRPGLYYSLWDRNYPRYSDDSAYFDFMAAQLTELLTDYGPVVEMWFDGGWDKDYPSATSWYDPAWRETADPWMLQGGRWKWRELYEHIHSLQPDCLVVNNSSSDRPGQVRYHPVDIRTCEHFDFVHNGQIYQPLIEPRSSDNGRPVYLPLEYCTTLNPDWFWRDKSFYSHPSSETIQGWLARARRTQSNLLLNIGPDKRGLIPEYHRPFLPLNLQHARS